MTVLDTTIAAAATAPSPSVPETTTVTGTAPTTPSHFKPVASSTKQCIYLTKDQLSSLTFKVYRHTPGAPIQQEVLQKFMDLVNASFTGDYHAKNFGGKLRYPTLDELVDDLNHDVRGGWVFMLCTPEGVAVSGAKITFSGDGMDGGPGIHTVPNPNYVPSDIQPHHGDDDDDNGEIPTFWLGALGSIAPGSGSILISRIKTFLSESVGSPHQPFIIRAYTISEWGVNPGYTIPKDPPLPTWFKKLGFQVLDYSWKAPGTWGSFYGGCLSAIEYVHLHQQH